MGKKESYPLVQPHLLKEDSCLIKVREVISLCLTNIDSKCNILLMEITLFHTKN